MAASKKNPTEAIRLKASRYPGVDEGTACTQSSFKAGKKAFLFVGMQGGRYKLMFKLKASIPQAAKLAEAEPDSLRSGLDGLGHGSLHGREAHPQAHLGKVARRELRAHGGCACAKEGFEEAGQESCQEGDKEGGQETSLIVRRVALARPCRASADRCERFGRAEAGDAQVTLGGTPGDDSVAARGPVRRDQERGLEVATGEFDRAFDDLRIDTRDAEDAQDCPKESQGESRATRLFRRTMDRGHGLRSDQPLHRTELDASPEPGGVLVVLTSEQHVEQKLVIEEQAPDLHGPVAGSPDRPSPA